MHRSHAGAPRQSRARSPQRVAPTPVTAGRTPHASRVLFQEFSEAGGAPMVVVACGEPEREGLRLLERCRDQAWRRGSAFIAIVVNDDEASTLALLARTIPEGATVHVMTNTAYFVDTHPYENDLFELHPGLHALALERHLVFPWAGPIDGNDASIHPTALERLQAPPPAATPTVVFVVNGEDCLLAHVCLSRCLNRVRELGLQPMVIRVDSDGAALLAHLRRIPPRSSVHVFNNHSSLGGDGLWDLSRQCPEFPAMVQELNLTLPWESPRNGSDSTQHEGAELYMGWPVDFTPSHEALSRLWFGDAAARRRLLGDVDDPAAPTHPVDPVDTPILSPWDRLQALLDLPSSVVQSPAWRQWAGSRDARHFVEWIHRLVVADDSAVPLVQPLMHEVMEAMAGSPAFAESVWEIARDAATSCSDRLWLAVHHLQSALIAHQAMQAGLTAAAVLDLGRRAFRRERIDVIASAKVDHISAGSPAGRQHHEQIETHLAYAQGLHHRLDLGGPPPEARFLALSGELPRFLALWTPWQWVLRREMPDRVEALLEGLCSVENVQQIQAQAEAALSAQGMDPMAAHGEMTVLIRQLGRDMELKGWLELTDEVLFASGLRPRTADPTGGSD